MEQHVLHCHPAAKRNGVDQAVIPKTFLQHLLFGNTPITVQLIVSNIHHFESVVTSHYGHENDQKKFFYNYKTRSLKSLRIVEQ